MLYFATDVRQQAKEIAEKVDEDRYLRTLQEIIRIPSPTGAEKKFAENIAERLVKIGFAAQVDECANVVGHLPGGSRRLLVNAHIDTMMPHPGMKEPYHPRIEKRDGETRVYGLGSTSSKGHIASMIEAMRVVTESDCEHPALTFLGVARDFHPVDHGIVDAFRLHKFEADGALVGEPTDLRLGIGARGYAHIQVEFTGQPHHAGQPDNSRNPIVAAAEFVRHALAQPLPEHPRLGAATLTPIEWRSEGQRPQSPQTASVLLDRRLLPNDETVETLLDRYKLLAASCSDSLRTQVELKRTQYPWQATSKDAVVESFSEAFRLVTGSEPVLTQLPHSSAAGYIAQIGNITPVAFGGEDVQNLGPNEHTDLSKNVVATRVMAAAIILFAATAK